MKCSTSNLMWIWAAKDILRHPLESALLGGALLVLVVVMAMPLLLTQALSGSAERILLQSPALVVRRLNPGGWAPLPAVQATAAARAVAGVTSARARIWGTVRAGDRTVTVIGGGEALEDLLSKEDAGLLPNPGQAVAGPGILADGGDHLTLQSPAVRISLKVIGRLPPAVGLAAHDVIWLHDEDARRLLSIPEGFASDLAVDVFHDGEADTLGPDLVQAFPWPIQIVTRSQAIGDYQAGYARRGGLASVAGLPSLLALALIVAAVVRERTGRRYEVGLLKAMGWTTRNIIGLQMFRAVSIGLPVTAVGLLTSYGLVFWPGATWPGYWLLGWDQQPPALFLDPAGALLVLLEVGGLVLVPYLAATLWPAARGAAADPQGLIEGGVR